MMQSGMEMWFTKRNKQKTEEEIFQDAVREKWMVKICIKWRVK